MPTLKQMRSQTLYNRYRCPICTDKLRYKSYYEGELGCVEYWDRCPNNCIRVGCSYGMRTWYVNENIIAEVGYSDMSDALWNESYEMFFTACDDARVSHGQ